MSMSQEDIGKYKSLYLQTSWGYLNMLRKNVAFLLHGTPNEHAVESAHLAAHSLKSQSILMGYNQIGKFSKQIEVVFVTSKEKVNVPDKDVLEVILSGLSKIQLSLTQIAENGQEVDMSEDIALLDTKFNK